MNRKQCFIDNKTFLKTRVYYKRFISKKIAKMSDPKDTIRSIDQVEPGIFKVIYENDAFYKGGFVDGKREGHGEMDYGCGNTYEGDFHNNLRHGKGKYEWADGSIQSGNWINNYMHGEGEMFESTNGQYYCGEFVDDNYQGNGTMIYGDRSKYEGEWFNDKRHGNGKFTDAKKNTYDGYWQNDKKHGQGIFMWADQKEYYDGEWKKGRMSGQGIYHYSCGNHYEGDMFNDEEDGEGYMKYANGNEFRGEFYLGSAKKGIMCYDNGDIYEGELGTDYSTQIDVPHGKGQMDYWEENVTYRGEWLNGKRHGQGTMYVMDDEYDYNGNRLPPRVYSGEWQNNMYYEPIRILLHLVNRHMIETRRSSLGPLPIRWVE